MTLLFNIEQHIVKSLIQEHHSDLEKEKIEFGVRLILNDSWKVIIVYLIAFLLDYFLITLLTHLSFFLLRHVCLGFHFQNSIACLFSSIIALPISVYIIDNMPTNYTIMYTLTALSTIVLCVFAPIGTKKRPIFNDNHKRYLKKKIYIRLSILWIVLILMEIDLQKFIAYGILLQTISVLTQKYIGGNEN